MHHFLISRVLTSQSPFMRGPRRCPKQVTVPVFEPHLTHRNPPMMLEGGSNTHSASSSLLGIFEARLMEFHVGAPSDALDAGYLLG